MTESQRWTLTRNLTCWIGLVVLAQGASIVPAHASVDPPLSDIQVGELQQTVDRYPDVFGGLWGDQSTHLVTIKLAPSAIASRQAEAMRLVDNVGSATDPKNNTSPKSWHRRLISAGPSLEVLKAVMARVTTVEPWAQDSSAARVEWYVDQKLGKVIIGVEGTTQSLEAEARAALGNLAELAVAERPVLHDRWSDVQPYFGGDRIAAGGGTCTAGFDTSMNVGGVTHYGMLTAGHCWPSSTVVYQGYYDNNGTLHYTGTMGNVGARSYTNNAADAEFIDATATGTQVSGLVWVGPNPTLNASKVAVQGTSFVGLGECFEGSTTGENCFAVVQQVDVCVRPLGSPTLCHLDDNTSSNGSTLATFGDSGGPVTKGDSFGGLVAYGTDSAGNSTDEYDTKLDFSLPALNASLVISSLGTTLYSSQSISGDQYLEAANGKYKLIMQSSDGNLVLYSPSTFLWASGTQGHPGDYALMQGDGNFVIYRQGGGIADWASGTQGNPGAYLIMQGDGNLVIYKQGGVAIWSSGTCCNRP